MSDTTKAESTSITGSQKQKQIQVNDFIKAKIEEFTTLNFRDDNLWEAYQDEFSDFSINDFKAASNSILRSLRIFLRSRGRPSIVNCY
ncbi:hypothetical protein HI914_02805 [Erysiphe necator]|nr:hypothetical protein HI914_02805 [Erysiphe necator]